MAQLLFERCLLPSLGLITQLDHDHMQSFKCSKNFQWFTCSGNGCLEHPETVSNILKMKGLSCSPHSVHFAVGETRHLKMFWHFLFLVCKVVLTIWLLTRNPELPTMHIYSL